MKITAPLLLLPLLLAACGTQSATPTADASTYSAVMGNSAKPSGPTYVQAFEAAFERELVAQGLSGVLSAQATTPKSALTVLKVSDTTARAYMKTTYPAATGCALDWGDGTATTTITTPSVVATDKADHTYTKSGTYTVKLTCGADIKTSTFAAVVPIQNLGLFETYSNRDWSRDNDYYDYSYAGAVYDKGFSFISNSNYFMRQRGISNSPISLLLLTYGLDNQNSYFKPTNGSLFNLNTITASGYYSSAIITGYDISGQVVGSVRFDNIATRGAPLLTQTLNWKKLSVVKVTSEGFAYLNLDDISATIIDN
ncbi:hypothetical protein [Deinococcus sp. Leaf326]|uniref:hypothetical protein n=1 Tax=Deinococcus sp. Leaf326 TaxID=1736338 RepID=UPI0009EB2C7C|nr:hypothetical protein [Deinococcus sp. Leaf326]